MIYRECIQGETLAGADLPCLASWAERGGDVSGEASDNYTEASGAEETRSSGIVGSLGTDLGVANISCGCVGVSVLAFLLKWSTGSSRYISSHARPFLLLHALLVSPL